MKEKFQCENCEFEFDENADFCPNCGSLFIEGKCSMHADKNAEGVCLVCGSVCCSKCGLYVSSTFLCNEHSDIEVYESMGRVYGSSDLLEVDYIVSILEAENLHPFKYSRKASPISLGGVDYSLFKASGDFDGHIINEMKIMVPLAEYLQAEKIIEDIKKE